MIAALTAALLLQAGQASAGDTAGYWQQDVRYTIRAALDEPSGTLVAAERIVYRNRSPDTLRTFHLHLYLNAFRPGSRWAESERREGIRRFADLPEPYSGFERLTRVSLDGIPVTPRYPFAPDSTIASFDLPRPLAPGDSLVADVAWLSRPSAIPRRQGREGRRFDFAQWYPKVVVYDRRGWQVRPLYMAGEFYGEFGTYDVALDLEADQVVAATGVPVEGDPGWHGARATPETPVTLQADWYGDRAAGGVLAAWGPAAPGRRRVRFHAEEVHDFAWSANPDYVYEEGRRGATVLRTLYLPEDRTSWGGGLVIGRMGRLLAWMDTVFGAYPWPHFTAVHRIEGGGTEFPMLVMNGGPSEGLVFHEGAHQYAYGILANNEWRDGWLDEGFASFQGGWRARRGRPAAAGGGGQTAVLGMDLDGWSQPLSLPAEQYADFSVYGTMSYTKGALFFEMLRYVVGEEAFGRGLREYYARWRLRHVDEDALRRAMEDVSGQDLRGFFAQWLHGTPLVDYRVGSVRRARAGDGWLTRVTVERLGDGVMPVDIAVPQGDTTLVVRTPGVERRETVEVATQLRPGRVELDPARATMDWNYLNNREGPRLPFVGTLAIGRSEHRLGWSATTPARRDRRVVNWLPLAWYNDLGGLTVGVQSRSNYMGRFALTTLQLSWPTGLVDDEVIGRGARARPDVYVAVRNPTWLRAPRREVTLSGWWLEGRAGGTVGIAWDRRRRPDAPTRVAFGASLGVMAVADPLYLRRIRWDQRHTIEATTWVSREGRGERTAATSRVEVTVGIATPPPEATSCAVGGVPPWCYVAEPRATYVRGSLESRANRRSGVFDLRWRGVAQGIVGGLGTPLQRRVFLSGPDPYATFGNPFLRSGGGLLTHASVRYQPAGGAGLRGFAQDVSATWAVALNAEAAVRLVERPSQRILNTISAAAFIDAALLDRAALGRGAAADAGLGLRAGHRIGPTRFVTRLDLPLLVSRPVWAVSGAAGDGAFKFRWVWSLEEAF